MPNCKRMSTDPGYNPLNGGESNHRTHDDKYVHKEVERMRKGREERERVKKYTERGIILNESASKSSKRP